MAHLPEEVVEALEEPENIKMLVTADEQKNINMVPIGSLVPIDDETLAYASFFSGKTKKNIEATRKIAVAVFQPPMEGYQVKGTFVRWETSGEIYDKVAGPAMEQLEAAGLSFTPSAVGIIKVTEAYALSIPLAGEKLV